MPRKNLTISFVIISLLCGLLATSPSQSAQDPPTIRVPMNAKATIAVMPFFSGKWQPAAEEKSDQTLACSLAQICRTDPNIKQDAEHFVTSLAFAWLEKRFDEDRLIPLDRAASTFQGLQVDPEEDTPRSLAVSLGKTLGADLVLVGTVWRFRERGAISGIPDSPAAVSFAVYLVDVHTGQRKWRGVYDVAQSQVTDDLLTARQHARLGIGWLSVEELAKQGVEQVFKKFPL